MNLSPFIFFSLLFHYGSSEPIIHLGYQLSLAVPAEYHVGFTGKAYIIQTNQTAPNFRLALGVEAIDGKYSCSLQVFLGDVKVWDSGHYSRFYTTEKCLLELTQDGDLRLKGPKDQVGWKTGTSGQDVERLKILRTGNLVLMDSLNKTKWQSFNFPTDVMLWGQRLNVATRLTSSQDNSSFVYSFEIDYNRVALYLNTDKLKYSYWEFKPSMNRNITFIKLGSKGLDLFDIKCKKIARIPSPKSHPIRFLALNNETGNLGLYYYSDEKAKFAAFFHALNSTCDLPMACRSYGICTLSNACSCIQLSTKEDEESSECTEEISGGFCGGKEAEMLELENVGSVLKDDHTKMVNISKEACKNLCLQDCKCASTLYFRNTSSNVQQCYLYRLVLGLKQLEKGTGFSYMVKVPKGTAENNGQHNLKKWVFILVGAIDGLIILIVVGGVGYWMVQKRNPTLHSEAATS
ncbi:EP1-like glycoprotein 3 [Neltuma alba]|uniref:EP1-like glycoprotein 3 n=1 Tax=Neltuma alba TaxID=207710 RepID=UPI0010A45341|nr:EP1-like glycoprotein 3 [Prosopis alba]